MAINGPIILVEDDQNDTEAITEAIREVGVKNKVIAFANADVAFDYLLTMQEQPFFILCDIRMPVLDGLSFRRRIIQNQFLKKKSIPFIFLTSLVSQAVIDIAFIEMDVQGFYQKERTFESLKTQLLTICMYWKHSLHPNKDS